MEPHICNDSEHTIDNKTQIRCKLYEYPELSILFDNAIRPGGYAITDRAMELCKFQPGARLLDVGCGCGGTVEYLNTRYNMKVTGIDPSKTLIERGKARNSKLDIRSGEGEFLEFPSLTFDGILMECTLSLMENHIEAIHEAYCVLRKGGKLIISDFYLKDNEKRVKSRNPSSCIDGAFNAEELRSLITEMGFSILTWEEKNTELKSFTSSLIMNFGSMENFFRKALDDETQPIYNNNLLKKKLGYFLLIAEKA
jgi:arsenite methyltransferase